MERSPSLLSHNEFIPDIIRYENNELFSYLIFVFIPDIISYENDELFSYLIISGMKTIPVGWPSWLPNCWGTGTTYHSDSTVAIQNEKCFNT